jgi:8-oxo-dGTP pyrophosphatase MutT (NUDIX family)
MRREVIEETGLKVSYKGIFYIRQVELTKWDKPDLYFAMLADLAGDTDQEVRICEKELSAYTWLSLGQLKEYAEKSRFTHASQFGVTKLI